MLKQAANELLTQVAPATAGGAVHGGGAVMRRYWIPVLLREEIPIPCADRGAPLFFGRNERSGLRCMYHGWKFTVDGHCADMPKAPPASDFKARIRHASYPCVERDGMVWAHLGPERPVPPFPAMGWIDLPPDHLVASKQLLSCNYAQAMEGDFDPSHISFLHSSLAAFRQLEELVGSGLTPMQAIVAGTSRAAELLGLAGRIGAVNPATSRTCSWSAAIRSAPSRPLVPSRWSSSQAESSGTMLLMSCEGAELDAFYRRYLQRCNEHRFGELGEFVGENVEVNGEGLGLRSYAEGLAAVVALVPDYYWDVRHLLVDGCWLSAHLTGTGTTPAGQPVSMPEFAIYRVACGRIVEVWGDLDRTRLAM